CKHRGSPRNQISRARRVHTEATADSARPVAFSTHSRGPYIRNWYRSSATTAPTAKS
ncbi:hypothetical protein IscW_ISCW020193, partial [Ixodes scapularis]